MSEIKFESTPKIKSSEKHKENIITSKQASNNNRPLFLVKQNQDINDKSEKTEKNINQKEELNTNHSINTTNENFSQEKGNSLSEQMIIENKECENTGIIKEHKEEIKNNNTREIINNNISMKSSINNDISMNKINPFIVSNLNNTNMPQNAPNLNHHMENIIHPQKNIYNNNTSNEANNRHVPENSANANLNNANNANKRSLRMHSMQSSVHHLLEDAIIKKEFQEPKRKVNLKNDLPPSYGLIGANDPTKTFQKIINIDESDSFIEEENESDFSQEFEEEDDDDEEYNLSNNNINWLNKRKKENRTNNCLFNNCNKKKEYDDPICNELSELIRKFGFNKVIENIYNIRKGEISDKEIGNNANMDEDNNDIIETNNINKNQEINNDVQENPDQDLNTKLKEILSKSNSEDIHLLLIRILSDNFTENQQKLIEFVSKQPEGPNPDSQIPQIELRDADDRFQKRSRSLCPNNNLGVLREKRRHTKRPSPPFYYGKHYYKKNGKIYCYVPKAKTVSFNRYTLYCLYRGAKEKCMAKLIVHQNGKDITFVGNHLCKPKMTMEDFCKKYPNIKNTDWTHIQFAFRNQKLIVMNQI